MKVKKLTKEMIAEAANCKTTEEKLDFLSKNKVPLSDGMLDQISGGGDIDFYYCKICDIRFDHWYESVWHDMRNHYPRD